MHGGLAPRHRGQVSTRCRTHMLQVRGSEFLRGPSDLCLCAICLVERLHMALFVRGLRHVLATGGLRQWWQVILIIIGKTVTAVTNPIFDYRHRVSVPFFKNAANDAFDQRQTICSNNWNECKTTWLWPGVAYNEIPWLTKDIRMPECVRWKECKINFGIWGIFFPSPQAALACQELAHRTVTRRKEFK